MGAAVAILLALLALGVPASGQPLGGSPPWESGAVREPWGAPIAGVRWTDAAVDLGRVCIHEASFAPGDDCAALHDALRTRGASRGLEWDRWARVYSDRIFDRTRTDRRAWIARLRPTLARPRGFDRRQWEAWGRAKVAARFDEAAAILRGEITSRCERSPDHWGGPVVDRARIRAGVRRGYWDVVDCGDTQNVFLRTRGLQ
jgi:hypothetical protein